MKPLRARELLGYNRNKAFLWKIYQIKKNVQINDICDLI